MHIQEKEIEYMNVAKAIGICLIVLGHSFQETSSSSIRSFVYLFHVPLFFIISGYFFRDTYIEQPLKLIINRIKSLWYPFFRWTLIFVLLHNVFFSVFIYSEKITFRNFPVPYYSYPDIFKKILDIFLFKRSEPLLGAFWFLQCLFFCVIIYLSLNIIIKRFNLNKLILPLLILLIFFLGNAMYALNIRLPLLPWDIRLFCVTVLIYYIGKIYEQFESKIPMNIFYAALSFAALLLIDKLNLIKIINIESTFGLSYKPVIYLILAPILGSYFIFYISKNIVKAPIKKVLNYIGKNTIAILALHFLAFKIVSLLIV
jgi:fucose 4-O-acetylase-like acetyltransferase